LQHKSIHRSSTREKLRHASHQSNSASINHTRSHWTARHRQANSNVYEVQLVVLTLTAKAASVKLTFFILSLLIMVWQTYPQST